MPSKVGIANLALGFLGQDPITAFTDGTTQANLISAVYDSARDAVLEEAEWSFAIRYEKLPQEAAAPTAGYAYAYTITPGTIRVLTAKETTDRDTTTNQMVWEKQGLSILTDSGACYVRVLYSVDDPNVYSPGFVQALAARLAADLAIPLTTSRAMQDQLWKLYQSKLSDAQNMDGMQGRSRRLRSSQLTANR